MAQDTTHTFDDAERFDYGTPMDRSDIESPEFKELRVQSLGGRAIEASLLSESRSKNTLDWQKDALCAQTDPELFFLEQGGSTVGAKKICAACDVRKECLEYALANDEEHGIWGGCSRRERLKIVRRAHLSGGTNG